MSSRPRGKAFCTLPSRTAAENGSWSAAFFDREPAAAPCQVEGWRGEDVGALGAGPGGRGRGQREQHRAAIAHGAEVALQWLAARVVAARHELRVVDLLVEQGGARNGGRRLHARVLVGR